MDKKNAVFELLCTTLDYTEVIMWIVCKNGEVINSDMVARFRKNGNEVVADMPGVSVSTVIGNVDLLEIMHNITTGVKVMEVNDYVD